jgi:signal transduction histidine kinase
MAVMSELRSTRVSTKLQIIMLVLNAAAIAFISIFIYVTTLNITESYIARRFISGVAAVPENPLNTVITVMTLFAVLIVSFILREVVFPNRPKVIYSTFAFDFIVSLAIIILLNFNYNCIILFIFSSVIVYSKRSKGQYILMSVALFIFLMANYDLVSISYKLFSVKDYIAFYDESTQQYLLGINNGLYTLNIIMFILYCVYVIKEQQGTIYEVNMLYDQLSKANQDLQIANEQLKDYAEIREKMGETKERNRLAREIHDTLGHTLTSISAGLDACIATAKKSPESTVKQLEVISNVTRQGLLDVRKSVNQLRPDTLERADLKDAIQKMVEEHNALSDTKIAFECPIEKLRLDEDEENTIYRVIQESITNAIRHGKATVICIDMKLENRDIVLNISDNGRGCIAMNPGFGTKHIMERIHMLNGTVSFDGTDGFKVDARIPIRWGKVL